MAVSKKISRRSAGFDFTHHVRLVCQDMVTRLPELGHVDLSRVAISFSQARNRHGHGLQATLTPMRFEAGELTTTRGNQQYTVQRLYDGSGRELLYILSIYLPRFLNHSLSEKVTTILHELWHISPYFDGDLRRFAGRCYAHGASQKEYDAQVDQLASKWWALQPPAELYAFLKNSFDDLQRQHGRIYGVKIPNPKLIPVGEAAS
jgi:hypothetical protein